MNSPPRPRCTIPRLPPWLQEPPTYVWQQLLPRPVWLQRQGRRKALERGQGQVLQADVAAAGRGGRLNSGRQPAPRNALLVLVLCGVGISSRPHARQFLSVGAGQQRRRGPSEQQRAAKTARRAAGGIHRPRRTEEARRPERGWGLGVYSALAVVCVPPMPPSPRKQHPASEGARGRFSRASRRPLGRKVQELMRKRLYCVAVGKGERPNTDAMCALPHRHNVFCSTSACVHGAQRPATTPTRSRATVTDGDGGSLLGIAAQGCRHCASACRHPLCLEK